MAKSETVTEQEKPVRGKLLTATQAAEYIGSGKTWIYSHLATRTLPFPCFRLKYGKRFDTADLDDYLRKHKDSSGAAPVGNKPKGGPMGV